MTGIAAAGAYAPRHRLEAEAVEAAWGRFDAAGVERTAVPNADEDALTMAHEAAARALDAAGYDGDDVAFLAFASTTPPLAEEDLAVRLGSTLGVPADATRHVFTGSTRAGTRALTAGLDAGPWDEGVGLVVASDCPRGEPQSAEGHAAGAGAAAFVLADDAPASVLDAAEYANAAPGTRFRGTGAETVEGLGVTAYDRRAFTETLAGAVEQVDVGDVDAVAVQAPDGKLPYRAAGALGVDADAVERCTVVHDLGDAGAASVPLSFASALADGAERVLAAAYGSGAGADALVLAAGDIPVSVDIDGDSAISYAEALRLRGEITSGPPEGGGAHVSVPSWRRTLPQRHRLVAGRCPDCGALAFPPEGACPDCDALVEYEDVALSGTGTVAAATTISSGGAPPEFAEQQARAGEFDVVVVEFDAPGGDSVAVPVQVAGADAGSASIGDRVDATMRRIYTQEGVTRYGFKARPTE